MEQQQPQDDLWEEMLIEDVRARILRDVDYLTLHMMALTSKVNRQRAKAIDLMAFSRSSLDLLASYGTTHLLDVFFRKVDESDPKKSYVPTSISHYYLGFAIKRGNLDGIDWFLDRNVCWEGGAVMSAALSNPIVLERLHQRGKCLSEGVLQYAIEFGRDENAKWICEHADVKRTHNLMYTAICHGSVQILQLLMSRPGWYMPKDAAFAAAQTATLDSFKWIFQQPDVDCSELLFDEALKHDNVPVVHFLLDEWRIRPNARHMERALDSASAAMVTLLLDYNCPFDVEYAEDAALMNCHRIEFLQFLVDRGVTLPSTIFGEAMERKYISTMDWLLQRGYPTSFTVHDYQQNYPSQRVRQWLREHPQVLEANADVAEAIGLYPAQ